MKRTVLAAVLVSSLLQPALAKSAIYTLSTTAAQEAAITDARTRFNNSLPGGQADPNAVAANGTFLLNVLTSAITSWNASKPVPLTMDVPTKNAVVTMLQAAVARADANSPAAQTMLNELQASQ